MNLFQITLCDRDDGLIAHREECFTDKSLNEIKHFILFIYDQVEKGKNAFELPFFCAIRWNSDGHFLDFPCCLKVFFPTIAALKRGHVITLEAGRRQLSERGRHRYQQRISVNHAEIISVEMFSHTPLQNGD